MYTILGATGNIGKVITENLLEKGEKVFAIGRDEVKLKKLAEKGAEIFIGDLLDTEFLKSRFIGAKGVFSLIPPNFQSSDFRKYQNNVSESIFNALNVSEVKYVVNLSSLGAHLSQGVGVVNGLFDHEQRLNKLENINVLHLRPSYFMENLFGNISLIKSSGVNGSALKNNVEFPIIATKDIGDYASKRLLNLDFNGKQVQELLGERDLTMEEITSILGRSIGKPDLKYVEFSYEDTEKAILQMGVSKDLASQFVELYKAINEGIGITTLDRNPENTTSTSIEDFSREFSKVYLA